MKKKSHCSQLFFTKKPKLFWIRLWTTIIYMLFLTRLRHDFFNWTKMWQLIVFGFMYLFTFCLCNNLTYKMTIDQLHITFWLKWRNNKGILLVITSSILCSDRKFIYFHQKGTPTYFNRKFRQYLVKLLGFDNWITNSKRFWPHYVFVKARVKCD